MEHTTIADIFVLSLDAENEARDFYQHLARAFSTHGYASTFFSEMARDESAHIENIVKMRDATGPGKLAAPAPEHASNLIKTFLIFSATEGMARVKDLEDACRMAVNLEFSEINKLHELLIDLFAPSDETRKRNFDLVKAHMGKLEAFRDKTGDTAARREIKAS